MSLSSMKKEEIELLSYTDLTELILMENKGSMNTADIFKKISSLVSLSDEEYTSKIGDFYTSLTTDKRFIFLDETAEWDLRNRHTAQVVVADDDDDEEEIEEEDEEEILDDDTLEEDVDSVDDTDDDLDDEDDIGELSIITDEELEES